MAFQPTPTLGSSTIEMGSELSDRALTSLASDDSMTLNTPEVQPSEKKEYEETAASKVALTPGVDDYPDGGVTAWCVVLGVSRLNHSLVFSNFLMRVRSCRLCVPISRRMLHSIPLVSNNWLTSEDSLRFGLANSWGVRASQIFLLADVAAHPRNRYSNFTTNELSYQRPRPQQCRSTILHIECSVDLISECQRMDRVHPGMTTTRSRGT